MTRKKQKMLIAKEKEGFSSLRIWLVVIIAVLIGAVVCYALLPDRESPRIVLKPGKTYLNGDSAVQIGIRDSDAGLEKIRVSAFQNGTRQTLVNQDLKGILQQMSAENGTKWSILNQGFPERAKQWTTSIPVTEMDLQEGEFRVWAFVTDSRRRGAARKKREGHRQNRVDGPGRG